MYALNNMAHTVRRAVRYGPTVNSHAYQRLASLATP